MNSEESGDRSRRPRRFYLLLRGVSVETMSELNAESSAGTDAVVVGAGVAGMTTALRLLDRGARVVLLDKEPKVGGNSAKASSGINGCCPPHSRSERNSDDSVSAFAADTAKSAKRSPDGLISVLVVDLPDAAGDLNIDTWAMSCRVLSRGMEAFIAGRLVELGQAKVAKRLVGTYIPSKKNKLVRELYARLGFTQLSDEDGTTRWALELEGAKAPDTHIENRPNESWKRLLNHG